MLARTCSMSRVIVGLLSTGASLALAAEPPTNRELIAAMPDSMESVMILRAEPLLREGCALKRELQGFFGVPDESSPDAEAPPRDIFGSRGENNLDQVVFREVVAQRPLRRAVAGADFQPPEGIGIGAYRFASVWITQESNKPIQEKVERGDGIAGSITKTVADGLATYESPVAFPWSKGPKGEPGAGTVFVSFPDEHTTVIAMSAEDARQIATSLSAKAQEIPARWQPAAAGLDIEAPILVLRKFTKEEQRFRKFDFENPRNLEIVTVPMHSYGVTSDAGAKVAFKLRVITSDPDNAEAWFYGGTFSGGFAPVHWDWTRRSDSGGLTADLVFQEAERRNHHSFLIVLSMFGVMMAI